MGIYCIVSLTRAPSVHPRLKSVNVGNIGIELREFRQQVEESLKDRESSDELRPDERTQEIYSLLDEDPLLAVAKTRLVLTDLIRSLARAEEIEVTTSSPQVSLGELERQVSLSPGLAKAIREALRLGNMAVHQQNITEEEAEDIVELTLEVVNQLREFYREQVLTPIEETETNQQKVEEYWGAKYRVRSIVPLVENPRIVTRVVPQEGLDELLEGYEQYGEFLVDVEKIDKEEEHNADFEGLSE